MGIYSDDGGVLPPEEWTRGKVVARTEYDAGVDESFHQHICGCEERACEQLLDIYSNPLMDSLACTFARCLTIAAAKNHDYAAESDPFRNFRSSELVGVDPARAILVRTMDKIARVSNLLDAAPEVADERIGDTLDDAINYLAILRAWVDLK